MVVSAGSKRSRTVTAEAKYDGQSLQETEIFRLVYTLCSLRFNIFTCFLLVVSFQGAHPTTSDGEVEMTLQQALTNRTMSATVKNCNGEYFVYKLQPTSTCPEAYCFGKDFIFNTPLEWHTVDLQWLEHWWLVYHCYLELILESLGKKSHSWRFGII